VLFFFIADYFVSFVVWFCCFRFSYLTTHY